MMNGSVICLDIGTSRIKATLFSQDGSIIWQGHTPTPYKSGLPPNMVEIVPQEIENTVRGLIERAKQYAIQPVCAITITGMAKTELPVDAEGKPLYTAISWMDDRCQGIGFKFEKKMREHMQHDPISTSYLPFRLKWMRKNRPEVFRKAAVWVNITDYIQAKLANSVQMVTDYSQACRMLLFDSLQEQWDRDLADFFKVDLDKLPAVKEAGTILGELDASFGLGKKVLVVSGAHDHMSASKASCLHQPTVPLLSTGTSEMLIVPFTNNRSIIPKGYNIDHQADQGRWALVGCVARSGDSLRWANQLFHIYQLEETPGFVGHYINYFYDLPIYVPAAIESNPSNLGAFNALTNRHKELDMALSVLEGLCLECAILAKKMSFDAGVSFDKYRLVGGFANIDPVLMFKSAALGKPIVAYPDVDMASCGGYLLCRKALDQKGTNIDAVAEEMLSRHTQKVVEPMPELINRLQERLLEYQSARANVLNKGGLDGSINNSVG